MDIINSLTKMFGLQRWQVENTVKLIDEGNTIPFIARYRKEAHGTLDDQYCVNSPRSSNICATSTSAGKRSVHQ